MHSLLIIPTMMVLETSPKSGEYLRPAEHLALHILHQQDLVPEHIEARHLYNPLQPGISQGQLHMWVDIFKIQDSIPLPIDLSPRTPKKYELRVIVKNAKDVLLDKISLVTG